MDIVELGKETLAAGLVVKAAVDIYSWSSIPSPKWAKPLVALLFGLLGAFALDYANPNSEVVFSGHWYAHWFVVGLCAAASAVIVTEVHEWARTPATVPPAPPK